MIGINFVPVGLIGLGLMLGILVGLVRKPRKKWGWFWGGLIGAGVGLAALVLLGVLDALRTL